MSFWSMKTGKPFTEWRSFSYNQNNRATNWFDRWLSKKKELTQISIHYVIHDDQYIVLSLTQTTRCVIVADIPFALSIRFSVIENIFSQKWKWVYFSPSVDNIGIVYFLGLLSIWFIMEGASRE